MSFDVLQEKIRAMKNPTVAGLDARIEYVPEHIRQAAYAQYGVGLKGACEAIYQFNVGLMDALCDIVPAVKPQAAFPAVQRLEEQLRQSRERCAALEEQVFRQTAEQYRNAGDVLLVQPDMEPDSVRRLCDAVSGTCGGRCAVFAGTGGSYRWAVIHPGQDLRAFIRDMNQALHSRGGGRDGFAQGSAACTEEELRAFFAQ